MKMLAIFAITAVVVGALIMFFFTRAPRNIAIIPADHLIAANTVADASSTNEQLAPIPEATQPTSTVQKITPPPRLSSDLPPQPQLANPPSVIKAIYVTAWVAGGTERMQQLIHLIKTTELNAVVIDIKDYSGYVSYAMDVPAVKASGAEGEIRIAHPNALIKELHDNGIYVIGRITNFQDPILAKAHPEWAMHEKATGAVWEDNHGLAWMDPAAKPVWDYLASIAKDAFDRGFDEVNFDYIRFASDGALGKISYPYWDGVTPKATVISNYFKFLRQTFPTQKISADLFGLATVNNDDLGIGQVIQTAFESFDYVSPMVYPSHYATGFLGYKYPAAYPYQVINYSMTHALTKLLAMGNSPTNTDTTTTSSIKTTSTRPTFASQFYMGYVPQAKLRPWLQDFGIGSGPGSTYTAQMIREEKQAVYDTLDTPTSSSYYDGWMMWDAANVYTKAAFDLQS